MTSATASLSVNSRQYFPPQSESASAEDLIGALLAEQGTLRTPVSEFAKWHDRHTEAEPAQARYYRDLIPSQAPGPGEQYAFEVDLDACTGCKACVAACHSLNGLDEGESWRDVGLLLGEDDMVYQQTVTTACHHCVDPACANGCPVLAYEKDADTGIVRHLDDQCIGCSYCIMKCPYDVPKFNSKRGIVRKCDMCQGRLAAGEAPACVQACPNGAIRIRAVKRDGVPRSGAMLAGAFDSSYTRPATRFVSARHDAVPARPADAALPRLDHAHTPLVWMLVLTQVAAGMFAAAAAMDVFVKISAGAAKAVSTSALAALLAGILLSVLHLGQPLKAWKAFLGWRKSWLSREIMAFGVFAGAGSVAAAAAWMKPGLMAPSFGLAALAAALAVVCSVMVYVDTQRPFWSLGRVSAGFFGTAGALGVSAVVLVLWRMGDLPVVVAAALMLASCPLVEASDLASIRRALRNADSPWHASALTMRILQPRLLVLRAVLCAVSAALMVAGLFTNGAGPVLEAALATALAGRLVERHQFFTASNGPRMPGL